MWHRRRFRAPSRLNLHPQRHITADATEEIKLDGYRAIGVKSGREAASPGNGERLTGASKRSHKRAQCHAASDRLSNESRCRLSE